MPRATLPTNPKGWFVALLASFVGFMSGYVTMRVLGEKWR